MGKKFEVLSAKLVGGRCGFLGTDVSNRAGMGCRLVGEIGGLESEVINEDFDPPCIFGLSVKTWFIKAVSNPDFSLFSKSFNKTADGEAVGNGE